MICADKVRKNVNNQDLPNGKVRNKIHNSERERVNGEGIQENILNVQDIEDGG